jgi:hypothetical protein
LRPNSRAKKGLVVLSHIRSFKALVALVAVAATTLLAGCGGGGAKDPFDPGPQPPAPPAFTLFPQSLNVYAGTPTVLTITSGVGPFQVFTSDSVVLPVTQVVSGATITLVANAVPQDVPVTLTVRDSLSRSLAVAATVKSAPLLSSLNVIPLSASSCGVLAVGATRTDIAAICSGETATARVTVSTAGASPIANRQIRFDVVQGPFDFVVDQAATVLAKTITIVTDQNGQAITTIKANSPVPSQVALIRATDLVSGNRVDGSFSIVQSIDGSPTFSVSPTTYTITGFYVQQCGGGSADYVVYGGTPPYTVFSGLPSVALLSVGNSTILTQQVTVPASGSAFRATTPGGSCGGPSEVPFTITDVAGRVITATLKSVPGTVELPVAPDPTKLVISPPNRNLVCATGAAVNFAIVGGTSPYFVATDRPYVPPTPPTPAPAIPNNGTTVAGSTVTLRQPYPVGTVITVSVADSASGIASATITCVAP